MKNLILKMLNETLTPQERVAALAEYDRNIGNDETQSWYDYLVGNLSELDAIAHTLANEWDITF